MELTREQKEAFSMNGFVKLPESISPQLVTEALRAINASLGTRGLSPDQLVKYRTLSYCPEIIHTPPLMNLFYKSPLWDIAEAMLGIGQVQHVEKSQIALRFPTMSPPREPMAHLDGIFPSPTVVTEGVIKNFTGLFGVFLSDIPESSMGNFTVWPGSHSFLETCIRTQSYTSLFQGLPALPMSPLQITARAGDAILCHYQLAHGIAANTSPFIRYAVFFRFSHVHHEEVHLDCLANIWREWPGMQAQMRNEPDSELS